MRYLILIFLSIIFLSCSHTKITNGKKVDIHPITNLVRAEFNDFVHHRTGLDKQVLIGEDFKGVLLESPEWSKELKVFFDALTFKSSWLDKFTVDSVRENGSLKSIDYTAIDKSLPTQEIKIDYADKSADKIMARVTKKNFLFSSNIVMSYVPAYGYDVMATQKVVLMNKRSFAISGRFIR